LPEKESLPMDTFTISNGTRSPLTPHSHYNISTRVLDPFIDQGHIFLGIDWHVFFCRVNALGIMNLR
ncbi:hypothetical protein ACJX0J_010412, partial [Zea mays]